MSESPLSAQMPGDGTLILTGEVVETELASLRARLTELTMAASGGVTVDVSGVSFLPSAAIGVLVRTRSQVRGNGGELRLIAAADSYAAQVLELTGVDYDPA